MSKKKYIFNKEKILVMGLGLHGGGVATAKWLLGHGAKVTVTDKRDKTKLAPSIAALKGLPVRFVLGKHELKDFTSHDMVVVNPGVPRESEYLRTAKKNGVRIENDASLFFRFAANPVIAVTGTRGKTTTTLWIASLLAKKYKGVLPSGNTPDNAFLKEFDRIEGKKIPAVAEMSSWQLELLPASKKAPHIAVITNLYPDHLNRYANMASYARAKANIFKDQKEDDFLILNHDNDWTSFYLKQKPKSTVFFVSTGILPKNKNGAYVRNGDIFFRFDGITQKVVNVRKFLGAKGTHNLENLLAAIVAVKLYDPAIAIAERDILKLPNPPMREEVIIHNQNLTIVNDSCSTSPEGTIAAIRRFSTVSKNLVLICGGTDKLLAYNTLAKEITRHISPQSLIMLEGSATTKLLRALETHKFNDPAFMTPHTTLRECVVRAFQEIKNHKGKQVILFSPGAASFEKFLHEFDRGAQFTKLVKKYIKTAR